MNWTFLRRWTYYTKLEIWTGLFWELILENGLISNQITREKKDFTISIMEVVEIFTTEIWILKDEMEIVAKAPNKNLKGKFYY